MSNARLEVHDLTVGNILRRQVRGYSDKIFLQELRTGRSFTYAELNEQVNRIANGLKNLGVAHGLHVALFLNNSAENIACFLALGKLGAVSFPVNTAARGASLQYFLTQSDSKFVIVDDELLPRLAEVLDGTPAIKQIVINSAQPLSTAQSF